MMSLARALCVIGALNWGLIGFFQFDLVAALFGGPTSWLSRLVYGLVGVAAIPLLMDFFQRSPAPARRPPE